MSLRFRALAGILLGGLLLPAGSSTALASPPETNDNVLSFPIVCPELAPDVIFLTGVQSEGANAFLPDGRVLVLKQVRGTVELTMSTNNASIQLSTSFSESRGGEGRGHSTRLVECYQSFRGTTTGVLDQQEAERIAADFDVDISALVGFIGQEVHFSMDSRATLWVLLAGVVTDGEPAATALDDGE